MPDSKSDLVVRRIERGTVIDHILVGRGLRVLEFLGLHEDFEKWGIVALVMGVPSPKDEGSKDIVKIEGYSLTPEETSLIALISPKATINVIEDYKICEKYQVSLPKAFRGMPGTICPNPNCVTNIETNALPEFTVESAKDVVHARCIYCERQFIAERVISPNR